MTQLNSLTVLPNTSLCAIVRDELMNPAGGISDFIKSTVPFVEEAVIVDTGSRDGTRQVLEELQAAHHNLRVFDQVFHGYASARNYSLRQARTEYVLVLDADERLTRQDFSEIKQEMHSRERLNLENPDSQHPRVLGYKFRFRTIFIDPKHDYTPAGGLDYRLFKNQEMFFQGKYWEGLNFQDEPINNFRANQNGFTLIVLPIEIKHFKASPKAQDKKMKRWYEGVMQNGKQTKISPSQVEGFADWKRYNPRRENYR